MPKIALGTSYSAKIKCLKEVLSEIGVRAEIIPLKVTSGVSEQPVSENETLKGSVNRAREALKLSSNADFGLGIEVGYHPNTEEKYEMFCCSSIVDQNGIFESCFSSRFLLPEFHQNVLKEGKFLGEYVREYEKETNEPVINYIREFIRSRKPLMVEATRNVLLVHFERKTRTTG